MHGREPPGNLASLVALQMADQMPFRLRWHLADLAQRLLHAILPKNSLPGGQGLGHGFRRSRLAHRDQPHRLCGASRLRGCAGDSLPHGGQVFRDASQHEIIFREVLNGTVSTGKVLTGQVLIG